MYDNLAYYPPIPSGLKYKEKIYFACHPDDFNPYFKKIAEDILKIRDCAIYYRPDMTAPWDTDTLSDVISSMRLLVIPVTMHFLRDDSIAKSVELTYVLNNHIPVLPLMQEACPADEINKLFKNIQFLNEYANDPTEIPYDKKLELFINSVLLGDELSKSIRASFSARIFLSYRKKDRKLAQQLMRIIHKNEAFRDVAIWYDEYLTPGENFNDEIFKALTESDLFALTVTPNIVNEPNYIMEHEFPNAVKQNKKILPAEMAPTDISLLNRHYPGMESPISFTDEVHLSEKLGEYLNFKINTCPSSDPHHLYLMGLAYLNGVDVEVDIKRGLPLLELAAQHNHDDAIRKLADMYQKGNHVAYDGKKAVSLIKQLISIRKRRYEQNPTDDAVLAYAFALIELGDYYYEQRNLTELVIVSRNLALLCDTHPNLLEKYAVEPYYRTGIAAYKTRNFSLAKQHLTYSLSVLSKLFVKDKTVFNANRIAKCHYMLGDALKSLGDKESAAKHYLKGCEIQEALYNTEASSAWKDLVMCYMDLAALSLDENKFSEAEAYYKKACGILEEFSHGKHEAYAVVVLSTCCRNLCEIAITSGDTQSALSYLIKAQTLLEDHPRSSSVVWHLSHSDIQCAFMKITSDYEKHLSVSEFHLKEALNITKIPIEKIDISQSYRKLALALFAHNKKLSRQYYEISTRIAESLGTMCDSSEVLEILYGNYARLAEFAESLNDTELTISYTEKLLNTSLKLNRDNNTPENKIRLAKLYGRLGMKAKNARLFEQAEKYMDICIDIISEAAEETKESKTYNELAQIYSMYMTFLFDIKKYEKSLICCRKCCEIFERLAVSLPNLITALGQGCIIALHMKNPPLAKEFMKKHHALSETVVKKEKTIDSAIVLAYSYELSARIDKETHNYSSARRRLELSLKLLEKADKKANMPDLKAKICEICEFLVVIESELKKGRSAFSYCKTQCDIFDLLISAKADDKQIQRVGNSCMRSCYTLKKYKELSLSAKAFENLFHVTQRHSEFKKSFYALEILASCKKELTSV